LVLGPLPLAAQLVEVGCWWLGRLDPFFARAVFITGLLVGAGLTAQLAGTLWDLFGRRGLAVLLGLVLLAGLGGLWLRAAVVGPFLNQERQEARPER
jgi:hypothetical protein